MFSKHINLIEYNNTLRSCNKIICDEASNFEISITNQLLEARHMGSWNGHIEPGVTWYWNSCTPTKYCIPTPWDQYHASRKEINRKQGLYYNFRIKIDLRNGCDPRGRRVDEALSHATSKPSIYGGKWGRVQPWLISTSGILYIYSLQFEPMSC